MPSGFPRVLSPFGQQLPRYRADASFTIWLYRIVTRRSLDRITRSRGTDPLDPAAADTADGPARAVERDSTIDAVTNAVIALPPAQRAALVLHHFEGLPYSDVAQITASTVPAVRSHLFRARRTLTEQLTQWR